jgi:uncharacterized protein (TIGR02145 family)
MKYLLTILFFPFLIIGCKTQENVPVKENPPTVFTKAASDVSLFSATLNGEVTDEGFTAATDRGFVFSEKNTNPSVSDTKVQSGYGKGVYLVKVDKLTLNTKYHFKAYSTNTKGTTYGEVQSFTTADYKIPTVTTDVPSNITYYSADLGGSVSEGGGLTVTQRGICYGLNPNPTTSDNKVISGEGLGIFKISVQKLKDNSKYYVKAYAINSRGTGYGNEQTFTTLGTSAYPRDNSTKVVEVISGGRIWMDRNLGATRVATSPTDSEAFGDLYQWGRGADGHEKRTSKLTNILSNKDVPGHNDFIIVASGKDWRNPPNDNLWQSIGGNSGINNPCPTGFRLPVIDEWINEMKSWANDKSAFASPLKLPMAGSRRYYDGAIGILNEFGTTGSYWSSTVKYTTTVSGVRYFGFYSQGVEFPYTERRVPGMSVRCIKN